MTEEMDPAGTIKRLVDGYQVSQAIHVIATLGVADLLVDRGRPSDDLAAATNTHPEARYGCSTRWRPSMYYVSSTIGVSS